MTAMARVAAKAIKTIAAKMARSNPWTRAA
jgi:hypothetical protein